MADQQLRFTKEHNGMQAAWQANFSQVIVAVSLHITNSY